MKTITKQQIKWIHTLKTLAGLSDEDYRTILNAKFNKNSSKNLSENQAKVLIQILDRLVNKDKVTERQIKRLKYLFNKIYLNRDIKEFIAKEIKLNKDIKELTTKEASKLIYILEQIEKWKK